jgi:hypothetical protein
VTARITTADLAERLERIQRRYSFDRRHAIRAWLATNDERWLSADENQRDAMVDKIEKRLRRHVRSQRTSDATEPDACESEVMEKEQ